MASPNPALCTPAPGLLMPSVPGVREPTAASPLRLRVVRGSAVADVLDDCWDALVRAQAVPQPLLLGAWLRAQLRHTSGEPVALVVEASGGRRYAAGAVLELRPRLRGLVRGAYWLGSERQRFPLDVVVPGGADGARAAALLAAGIGGAADFVSLITPADGVLARALAGGPGAAGAGPVPARAAAGGTWRTDLRRADLSRLAKAAGAERRRAARAGIEVTATAATEPDEVQEALARLVVLHRRRWHGIPYENAAFAATAADLAFHQDAVAAAARCGALAVIEIREDDLVVAASLLVHAAPAAVAYVKATVPAAGLRSPGQVLSLAVAAHALERGLPLLDLGGGPLQPGNPKARMGPVWQPALHAMLHSGSRGRALAVAAAAVEGPAALLRGARARRPAAGHTGDRHPSR